MPQDFQNAVGDYLNALKKKLDDATEYTHRSALENLIEGFAPGVLAASDPKQQACGKPDFLVTRGKVPLGNIETKNIGSPLDEVERESEREVPKTNDGEQLRRYRRGLQNLILTDYLEFRWYVHGKKRLTARVGVLDGKKLRAIQDGGAELEKILREFLEKDIPNIASAKDLAERMASLTELSRDGITGAINQEPEGGWFHEHLKGFRAVLIPELDEKVFADMFAQTLAYGLFAARVYAYQHAPNKEFSLEMAAFNTPKTNPFLHKLFMEVASELPDSISWLVDELVDLLRRAQMDDVLKDFGKGKGKDDPVVHFYETFLAAYDPKLREVRGVFFTPVPVVSYIVRSIDWLLREKFGREAGLADENTLVLDPATGTATFLYAIIQFIHDQRFKNQQGAWNKYVAECLLPRIFGFELLMAPYAVAHLKLAMLLEDTRYQFQSDQRLGIYITNTLDEALRRSEQIFGKWLSDEANEAAEIKKAKAIMVVLGNPPYAGHSANKGAWIAGLLRGNDPENKSAADYFKCDGKPLGERNPKWLNDDYVKFIRFAQWRIDKTGDGIVGFITNHSYIDNPTFRGMRQALLHSFNEIYVYDLHGSTKPKETPPPGFKNENVFDIQKGVAILLCVKTKDDKMPCRVRHGDLWGTREEKYASLAETDMSKTDWTDLHPTSPRYLFMPRNNSFQSEYEAGWPVNQIMPFTRLGPNSHRDDFAIAFDRVDAQKRVNDLRDTVLSDEEFRSRYNLTDTTDWVLADVRKREIRDETIVECLYRPFDFRLMLDGDYAFDRLRPDLTKQLRQHPLALISLKKASEAFSVFVTNKPVGQHKLAARYDGSYVSPLFICHEDFEKPEGAKSVNLSIQFLASLAQKLGLKQTEAYGLPDGITPEGIFHYAYAIFHAPTYRIRYAELLKIDFPRLPLTSDVKLFRALAAKGAELVALHLLESPKFNSLQPEFCGNGDNRVVKVQYTDADHRVWVNADQYFDAVPKNVWDFYIGGYQVCERWLKDRKGRELSYDDMRHYRKIVVALGETIRLMSEIDTLIPSWPLP